MTSKEKLIGRAQRVQVAAQAAGYYARLYLDSFGIELTVVHPQTYTDLFKVCVSYEADDKLQSAILGSFEEQLKLDEKGGEA